MKGRWVRKFWGVRSNPLTPPPPYPPQYLYIYFVNSIVPIWHLEPFMGLNVFYFVCSSCHVVGALYSLVRLILWYCGNPMFSSEIINVNTSKRVRLFTNITERKRIREKKVFVHLFHSNDKYADTHQIS